MKISVAMCTYNGEEYLSEQLNSILTQTVLPDEIMVCDDGSTDHTIEIINKLNNPIIKLQQNPVNLGITKNFEQAIKMCSGDVIFLSDQDDVWVKNKIETIIETFTLNPDAYMIFTDGYLTDKNLELYSGRSMWESSGFDCQKTDLDILFFRTIVAGSTMAIRKEALELIMPFSTKVTHDDWIALILTYFNRTSFINKKLIYYRMHKNQQIDISKEGSIRAELSDIRDYTPFIQFFKSRVSLLKELPMEEPYLKVNDYVEHLERDQLFKKQNLSLENDK